VQIVSLDEDTADFVSRNTFDHPYPTTKIMWIPDSVCWPCDITECISVRGIQCLFSFLCNFVWFVLQKGVFPDLLATSGDYLRVWRVTSETETRLECLLNNVCYKTSCCYWVKPKLKAKTTVLGKPTGTEAAVLW